MDIVYQCIKCEAYEVYNSEKELYFDLKKMA